MCVQSADSLWLGHRVWSGIYSVSVSAFYKPFIHVLTPVGVAGVEELCKAPLALTIDGLRWLPEIHLVQAACTYFTVSPAGSPFGSPVSNPRKRCGVTMYSYRDIPVGVGYVHGEGSCWVSYWMMMVMVGRGGMNPTRWCPSLFPWHAASPSLFGGVSHHLPVWHLFSHMGGGSRVALTWLPGGEL